MPLRAATGRLVFLAASLAAALTISHISRAADRQTAATLAPLYREYILGKNPKFNPQAQFALEEYPVPQLWETLQVQIFKAWAVMPDARLERSPILYVDGKILPFVETYGGGLLSAVVAGDALYYSYGFGSGIHQSKVGRLRLKAGKPEQHESEGLGMADMLVEKSGDRVRVVIRDFPWPADQAEPLGWIDSQESTRLRFRDDAGGEVSVPRGRPRPSRDEAMRRRAKRGAPFVQTQDGATRGLLMSMGILIDAQNHAYIDPARNDPAKIDVFKTQAAADAWNLLTEEKRKSPR